MLVTQWDGCLSCWDLLRRRSAPIVTAQLCDEPLLRLRPHEGVGILKIMTDIITSNKMLRTFMNTACDVICGIISGTVGSLWQQQGDSVPSRIVTKSRDCR